MHVSIVKVNVSRRLICQSKSPIWTDKWLKGFWNRSSYARDIGCQSSNTNPDSPCRSFLGILLFISFFLIRSSDSSSNNFIFIYFVPYSPAEKFLGLMLSSVKVKYMRVPLRPSPQQTITCWASRQGGPVIGFVPSAVPSCFLLP